MEEMQANNIKERSTAITRTAEGNAEKIAPEC